MQLPDKELYDYRYLIVNGLNQLLRSPLAWLHGLIWHICYISILLKTVIDACTT